jgi:hypothetical protein
MAKQPSTRNITTATPEELARVDTYTVQMRALAGQWMRAMNQMSALINSWNSDITNIIGSPANNPIKDSSNLVGISPLTDTDVYAITGYFEGCMSTYYDTSHQQIMTRAAGPPNTIG